MNRKGYTILELLAVIAIIGLIFTIGTISYSSLIRGANNRVFESYADSMHEAAIMYFSDNPLQNGSKETVMLTDLIDNNRISKINNPKKSNDICPNSYIEANRYDLDGTISIEYDVCLICDDYSNKTGEITCDWEAIQTNTYEKKTCWSSPKPSNPNELDTYITCSGGYHEHYTFTCSDGTIKEYDGKVDAYYPSDGQCYEPSVNTLGRALCYGTPASSSCEYVLDSAIVETIYQYRCSSSCKRYIN